MNKNQVGSYEAKTHLPALLEKVAKGQRITITRHGVPVAHLVSVQAGKSEPVETVIAQLSQFKQNHHLGDLSIDELKAEGRS